MASKRVKWLRSEFGEAQEALRTTRNQRDLSQGNSKVLSKVLSIGLVLLYSGATPDAEALCCDATLMSPLTRDGDLHSGAADRDGAALSRARRCKQRK